MAEQGFVYSLFSEVTDWFGKFEKYFESVRYLGAGKHASLHCSGGLYLGACGQLAVSQKPFGCKAGVALEDIYLN